MEAVRDAWTDERLDDLNQRVSDLDHRMEEGFKEMREEFRAVRLEMRTELGAVRSEMATMNRAFMQIAIGGLISLIVGFGATIATILTRL